jgi:hypothetical protein
MKTIIYSGPGPTFKGVVRIPTEVVFQTDWLSSRAEVVALCDQFKANYQEEPVVSSTQLIRQANWDF